ncbi:MAG TPA: hypothetical protein DCE42_16195 [Myxococcales bacterium]|nr:hypothetical protein [Deltaproteobacteria bacterium]MBU48075.1 hypothetical protein [Deltaproteobacteria bacterium]HAA56306.1 hypothetical protein [Myxococcales bacterium]|tara:strand:- start:2972 stop:4156 length:1185 start_codon:yes stop_codon:yes gene_type:complete
MKRLVQMSMLATCLLWSCAAIAQDDPDENKQEKTAPAPTPPADAKKPADGPGQGGTSLSFSPRASWNNAPREYLVQPGDTLWDISRRFLGSPWFWPKLWSKNPHIQNPHWIFPGNRIRFRKGEIQVVRKKEQKELPDIISGKGKLDLTDTGISIAGGGLGYNGLLRKELRARRDSFIDRKGLKKAGRIIGAPEGQTLITKNDTAYLSFKNLRNVTAGEKYTIFRVISKIKDPKSGRNVGYMIRLRGVLQISELKKKLAVARVLDAYREIEKGDLVGPYISNRLTVRVRRNEALVKGYVLRATSNVTLLGQFYQLFINKGKRHGVRLGNTFDIYRMGGGRNHPAVAAKEDPNPKVRQKIGTAIVIDVRLDTCVAVVTQSLLEIQAGDSAETSLIN